MSVIAPWVTDENNTLPYITLDELKQSPIAASLDFQNLVPNTGVNSQDAGLNSLILQSSSKIDAYCVGALSTMNATVTTENGTYTVNRNGQFIVHPYGFPILEVQSFAYAPTGGSGDLVPVNLTPQNTTIERYQFKINNTSTPSGGAFIQFGTGFPFSKTSGSNQCQYTYVNGFPNTQLITPAIAGVAEIEVSSSVGVYPNSSLLIWDGASFESVTVAQTFVPDSGGIIPLIHPLQFNHDAGVSVASPGLTSIKEACIHFVVAMCEERGDGGMTLAGIGAATISGVGSSSASAHHAAAYDLLDSYRNIWGRN